MVNQNNFSVITTMPIECSNKFRILCKFDYDSELGTYKITHSRNCAFEIEKIFVSDGENCF